MVSNMLLDKPYNTKYMHVFFPSPFLYVDLVDV